MEQKQNKVTPEYTLDWYIKWASSIILIFGMILTSNNAFPYNLYVSCIGITGWIFVGMLWRDRSIMILNTVALAIYLNGIVDTFFNQG